MVDHDIWFYMKLFLLTGLVAVVPFYGWKLWKRVYKTFKEVFMMWAFLQGERSSDHRQASVHTKLYPYMCETDILDEVAINELYDYSHQFYDNKYNITQIHQMVLAQSHIVFLRDRLAGSLRGFILFGFIRKKKYTIFYLGTTILDHQYRGGPYSHICTAYAVLKELIQHPFTPIYLIGKTFSYKSYLFGVNLWEECYPRYNRKTPDYLKSIISECVETILHKDETYDKERFLITKKSNHMKEFVAFLNEEDLHNPHIKYFVEMNPGWKEGNCMVCITVLSWYNVLKTLFTGLTRSKNKSKRSRLRVPSHPTKEISLIENSSGKYHVPRSEMDLGYETCKSNECHKQSAIIVEKPSLSARVTQSDLFKSVDLDL